MSNIQFIQTTPEELQEVILEGIKKEIQILKNEFQPKEPPKYMTRQEVCDMLHIDLSTLYHWTKKGKLNAYGIGNRVYYLSDEVHNSIRKIN